MLGTGYSEFQILTIYGALRSLVQCESKKIPPAVF